MKLPILLAAIICLSAAASAQEADVPPGELPVDPYVMSNENAGAAPFANETIYELFGGAAGVSRIVDDMVDRSLADPRISDVFVASDLVRLRRTLKEQFCFILAGPCDYSGKDMATSHRDHGITNREFNALVENLQLSMNAEGVPFRAQNKLLAKLAPMQKDIVTR
ncbi:MAG: group I truncated hemoglobin [Hyphomonas sp.]